ncbi:MAG: hypothetical protein H6722_21920 [Sandaracinus sp.]|nr:hypothetical protein [Sandaracinus sp.]
MKLRTLALAALVLTALAVVAVVTLRTRNRGEIDASAVLDPYLRRVQAADYGLALAFWADDAESKPTEDALREGWSLRQRERGTFERWRVAAAVPGGDIFTGDAWVDARVWLYFSDAPGTQVPVEWRIREIDGHPKITRLVVDPSAVGEADASRAF